ncbi:uncharacterized protein LOC111055222 [Nilaparvata lugens]|uniref:uncharacterized protein LOC111055222 n=1 Tax=Nilaparvata lugens TaxID=108931 RepID=UPI00193E21B4|nr:uncharacterized protein LOC111055222 [Nilaparvata lugens]
MKGATMPADGLDFVTFLPIEVIELIVSYWLQKNWRSGQFKTNHHLIEGDDCLKVGLNREYVVLCHVFSTQIWKFSPKPSLLQEICCGDFHFQTNVSDRSLVIRLRRSFHLYYQHKSDGRYSLVKVLSQDKCSADFDSDLDLESATTYCGCNRLVVIQRAKKEHSIAMWHLDSGNKICCISMDAHVKHILKAIISSNRLYLVVVVDNEYHLKIYDFLKNIWIHQLVVFKNIAFGVVPPEIQVNDKLIVCFSAVDINRDLCYGYSPMKVWDYNGKFLTSVILNSGRVDYFAFCLVDQFVIYRSSENVVKVWNPKDDKEICELPVEKEICKIDRSVGSLVVFSYEKFFDVWDWKRKTKLYRAKTEYENYDSLIHNRIEINAYHYTKQSRNKKCFSVFSFYDQDLSNSNNFLIPYNKGALKYER